MAQGIQQEIVKYLLKEDDGLSENEKTIWHIKLQTALDSARNLKRLTKAVSSDNEVDELAWKKYMRATWKEVVIQVDNYKFGCKFPDLQQAGYQNITTLDAIEKILEELPKDTVDELMDVANGKIKPNEPNVSLNLKEEKIQEKK